MNWTHMNIFCNKDIIHNHNVRNITYEIRPKYPLGI